MDVAGDTFTVSVSGELDIDTQERLRSELDSVLSSSGQGGRVVLDLTGVSFMGSVGLGLLVATHRIAIQNGIDFEIVEPVAADGMDVFVISGLDKVLPLSRRRDGSQPHAA
jgi:anti-anti-sigma factor